MRKIETRLEALSNHTSGAPTLTVTGVPTHSAAAANGSSIPSGNQRCQVRKGSVMRVAASKTIASTTQLMTVPK